VPYKYSYLVTYLLSLGVIGVGMGR